MRKELKNELCESCQIIQKWDDVLTYRFVRFSIVVLSIATVLATLMEVSTAKDLLDVWISLGLFNIMVVLLALLWKGSKYDVAHYEEYKQWRKDND